MKPSGVELVRAVQGAVGEVLAPEITSPHAEEAARTIAMMLEALAAEWDAAAEDFVNDSHELERLLGHARDALIRLTDSNEYAALLVSDIDGVLGGPKPEGLRLSVLSARHNDLNGVLERVLAFIEANGESRVTADARSQIYAHLRTVAVRGWSFWDAASFRGRMQEIRAGSGG